MRKIKNNSNSKGSLSKWLTILADREGADWPINEALIRSKFEDSTEKNK